MRLRTILNYSIALAGFSFSHIAEAQESVGKQLAGMVAVAVSEYRLGVDTAGKVIAPAEVEEARSFFEHAREVAGRLTGPNAIGVAAIVDSLADAVGRHVSSRDVAILHDHFVLALGDDAALELPTRHFDIGAGRALYQRNCASCHGNAGFGDGPGGTDLDPPPAPLAGDSARDIPSALMYRVVSVGVNGTAMAAWGATLTPDQRWDVIAYVNSLRASAGNATDGVPDVAKLDGVAIERTVRGYLDDAITAARAGRAADANDRAFDAYAAFDPVETLVRPRNGALVTRLEGEFLAFRTALRAGDTSGALAARARVMAELPSAIELATPDRSKLGGFIDSFLIILREGFEAMLIIGAIVAMLIRTGNGRRVRDVWLGALAAWAASAATAVVLQTTLRSLPATREVIEGVTMLIAVVVLFSVSYWILSKVESDKWRAYINSRVGAAIAGGGRTALAGVAFLVVYREGAETALFYQALLQASSASAPHIYAGLITGACVLVAIYFLSNKLTARLPLRQFFAVTGTLLYAMAFVFMGKGLRELQEGGALRSTPLSGWPTIDALGIYPSLETLVGQLVLLALFAFACWHTLARPRTTRVRRSQAVPDPVSGEGASTTSQRRQTPVRSSVPS
jgi:high-affinity iron transporter